MKNKKYTWWMIRNDRLQTLFEADAWSGHRGNTYHCSAYKLGMARDNRCEQRSREPWATHKNYCPKCHERLLNEIRRYPIRRNLATGKMLYDYSHGRLRWPQDEGSNDDKHEK